MIRRYIGRVRQSIEDDKCACRRAPIIHIERDGFGRITRTTHKWS